MIFYALLFITLLLAALSIRLTWRAARAGPAAAWPGILLGLSLGACTYLYGLWVYITIYARYAFAALLLLVLVTGLMQRRNISRARNRRMHTWLSLLPLALVVLYMTGTAPAARSLELDFPLRQDRYIILQGGRGLPTNVFHISSRGAAYAIDIARLNAWGNRANHIFSATLEDYAIFNDTIFSPCSGRVIRAVGLNPDNTPPIRKRGPRNLNSIVLQTDSFYVFLGHIKHNSLLVSEGQLVRTGEPLALVGNSGMSMEPHLHIQAHERNGAGLPWYREPPLHIAFNGRHYNLFEIISRRESAR